MPKKSKGQKISNSKYFSFVPYKKIYVTHFIPMFLFLSILSSILRQVKQNTSEYWECAYQGVRNVSLSENDAYVLNEWPPLAVTLPYNTECIWEVWDSKTMKHCWERHIAIFPYHSHWQCRIFLRFIDSFLYDLNGLYLTLPKAYFGKAGHVCSMNRKGQILV